MSLSRRTLLRNISLTAGGLALSPVLSPVGTGRRGAAKMVIFETDGVPNTSSSGTFVSGGQNSYYKNVSPGTYLGNGNTTVINNTLALVDKLVAPVANDGFSMPSAGS